MRHRLVLMAAILASGACAPVAPAAPPAPVAAPAVATPSTQASPSAPAAPAPVAPAPVAPAPAAPAPPMQTIPVTRPPASPPPAPVQLEDPPLRSDTFGDSCAAPHLQELVGRPRSVLATMRFAGPVRIEEPGMAYTMDYRGDRLRIVTDGPDRSQQSRIVAVLCG